MQKPNLTKLKENKHSKALGHILSVLFPLLTVIICEINQKNGFDSVLNLIFNTPAIFVFDIILVSFFYILILIWVKRVWISSLVIGLFFYIASCVEFYRYRASGVHFTWYDFSLFTNVADAAEFADIKIFPLLVIDLILLAIPVIILALLKVKINIKLKPRIITSTCALALSVAFMFSSVFSNALFDFFSVKHGGSNNIFVQDDLFDHDNMIAFLAQNATTAIHSAIIKKPDDYSQQTVQVLADGLDKQKNQQITPNIIVIMSESYCDFRAYKKLAVSDLYYKNFDAFADEGYRGTTIVSTFGGYTVKSEFELLFGLPIKSLNSTSSPQNLIDGSISQTTLASYFKSLNYKTTFIHPYTDEFYDRGILYPSYSFDNIYFEDSLKQTYFKQYIEDSVAFDKAISQIKSDKSPSYIHITTMQNHMPYSSENGISQFEYYMQGIKHTDLCLGKFKKQLSKLDEPTVILFVGDHYPCFTGENTVYDIIGIGADNCAEAYEQSYFIWSNYNLDLSDISYDKLSLFYLPYVIIEQTGLNADDKIALVMEQMKTTPIYTQEYNADIINETLDTLTYDLILGDRYSSELFE